MKAKLECWCGVKAEVTLEGEPRLRIVHITADEHTIEAYRVSGTIIDVSCQTNRAPRTGRPIYTKAYPQKREKSTNLLGYP